MDFQQNNEVNSSLPKKPMMTPTVKWWTKLVAGVLIVVISFIGGWETGHHGYIFNPKSFEIVNQGNQPQAVDYNLLWDAINVLNTKYIDKPVNQQQILYGAVSGAVAALGDPYTTFFDPTDLNNFQTQLSGSFSGIGAEVGSLNNNVVIIAPLQGSPAEKAGLKAKDIIAKVNGASTATSTVDQVVGLIRGPKGTQVTLTIIRGDQKPFDLTITRDDIVIKSVTWTYKAVPVNGQTKNIAVVTINQFGDDTTSLFQQAEADILKHSVSGIIIDLRNNPGGYLQSAVDVASAWVPAGKTVVTEAHSDGTAQVYSAEGNNQLAGIKTVILINGGTASAAEILSGALHDYKIAELIGEKSFGKGSVQELIDLPDNSAIKVTVAKWITPDGQNLNHNGLNPDIPVTLTQDQVNAGQDPQMDKAVQEVTNSK